MTFPNSAVADDWAGSDHHQKIRDVMGKEKQISAYIKAMIPLDGSDMSKFIHDFMDKYEKYCRTGYFDDRDYHSLRALYIHTRGQFCNLVSEIIGKVFPPQPIDTSTTLFQDQAQSGGEIVKALRDDGVYVFPGPLPASFIYSLRNRLQDCDAYNDRGRYVGERYGAGTRFRRLFVAEKDLAAMPEMVQLATDPLVLSVIQAHFGAQPILNTLASYKTHPEPPGGFDQDADAAQNYHFDFHAFRWLKMFVYLNDVDDGAGPHHFARTSHRNRPDSLWREGRIPDQEIDASYGDRVTTVCGPAGTVFIADTSAFHKGSLPERSQRTLAQFEYCNSLFGPEHAVEFNQRGPASALLERTLAYGPRTAQRFLMRYL